jgi:hypothetical protein
MSIVLGNKITTLMVSAANGDTYGDQERHIFRGIQAFFMPNVENMTLATPPGSPTNGDMYVVAVSPTGAWVGQTNNIAYWAIDPQDGVATTGIWEFYTPQIGWTVFDNNSLLTWKFNGTVWLWTKQIGTAAFPAATSIAVPFTATYVGTQPNGPAVTVTALNADPSAAGGIWVVPTGGPGAWTGFTLWATDVNSLTFNYVVEGY